MYFVWIWEQTVIISLYNIIREVGMLSIVTRWGLGSNSYGVRHLTFSIHVQTDHGAHHASSIMKTKALSKGYSGEVWDQQPTRSGADDKTEQTHTPASRFTTLTGRSWQTRRVFTVRYEPNLEKYVIQVTFTSEARVWSRVSPWEISWWTKWQWDRICSEYFGFTLSESFDQCSILIFIYTLLVTEWQSGRSLGTFWQRTALTDVEDLSIEKLSLNLWRVNVYLNALTPCRPRSSKSHLYRR